MNKLERDNLLAEAQDLFCRGMAVGYASGAPSGLVFGDTDWKMFGYREGDWRLEDRYYISPTTGKSVGETRIYFERQLIWFMSYGGFYKKEAIPCLKGALMANYKENVFNSGRGKNDFVDGEYIYIIASQGPCSFERFFAREGIRRVQSAQAGTIPEHAGGHDVWGMALI